MVGRTHEIGAAVSLVGVGALVQLPQINLPTLVGMIIAVLLGGEFPDVDQPTGRLWEKLPAGGFLGRLVTPFMGGHRHLSHSLLGLGVFGWLSYLLLQYLGSYILIDMQLVWAAFMIGFISHIVLDGFTEEGVPLLFPLPWSFGLPPVSGMRIKTGHWFEHLVVVPVLVLGGLVILFLAREHFTTFLHHLRT